ncbi:MAG: BatD family protein [Cyclobacteriaceae bacterium]|nr:BatD family protein [Cyclobacteriaceae bacterium]
MQSNTILKYVFLSIIVILFSAQSFSQEIEIQLGPNEIAENQGFTISIVVKNGRIKSYDEFPDFSGFTKRGTSSQSSTNIVNGQISSSHKIIMTYAPTSQGTFTLPPFQMEINGNTVSSPGKTIKVGAPTQRRQNNSPFNRDPFEDFFGRSRSAPTEYVDIEEDAFLALTVDKNEVYIGEGFTTTLSFYVANDNRAPLQFHELGKQLNEILKKLRPENCWEENFNIENINGEPVTINNKGYAKYKLYQATFYPLNTETIDFPSVELKMIKYKVARNPSFFGQNRQEDFKTFYSKAKKVNVKELPAHPLKDKVAVGDYRLDEKISSNDLQTGQSFSYQFSIYGAGNISAIEKPLLPETKNFDFYDPNIMQNISRRNNKVTGSKTFSYFGIPNEPGKHQLNNYFEWIFFSPSKHEYDTLRSQQVLNVIGESKKNEHIKANDLGAFYDWIELEDNELESVNEYEKTKLLVNIFIFIMLGLSGFLFFKKI